MTHRDLHVLQANGAGGDASPRRQTTTEVEPVPAIANLYPDIGDLAERVDNGRRLALVECITPPTPIDDYLARREAARRGAEPLPADTIRRVVTDVAEARDSLVGAIRYLRIDRERTGAEELRAEIERAIEGIDGLASFLAAEYGS